MSQPQRASADASSKDLRADGFPELVWEPGKLAAPLNALYQFTVNYATSAQDWYVRNRRVLRFGSRSLRIWAILLTTVAGIVPLLAQMLEGTCIKIHPLWTAVALALVGTLLALDKFWGATSGWVRYVLAEQELAVAKDKFRSEFELARVSWNSLEPTAEQAQAMVKRCAEFMAQIHGIVSAETKNWASEFAEAARQIEQRAKTDGAGKTP
jgi:hypothetical protein